MMKKLLFTMMAGLITTIACANGWMGHNQSVLNLRVFDNQMFIINLDGQKYQPPTTTKEIGGLAPGSHFLKVVTVAEVCGPNGIEKVRTVIFDGNINLPARSRISAKVGRLGNLNFLDVVALGNPYASGPATCGNTVNNGPVGYTMNTNVVHGNGSGHGYGYAAGMSPAVFNNLLFAVNNGRFESDKLNIARHAVANNGVSSAQLAQLMTLFSYESDKVELAKFGYNHTVDRGNFFLVNNSLTYSSSISELNNFVFASY